MGVVLSQSLPRMVLSFVRCLGDGPQACNIQHTVRSDYLGSPVCCCSRAGRDFWQYLRGAMEPFSTNQSSSSPGRVNSWFAPGATPLAPNFLVSNNSEKSDLCPLP